jgi:hypothetical protein
VTGVKPIAVRLQSISDVSAVNPLVAFYDIHGRKEELLFYSFVSDTAQGYNNILGNYSCMAASEVVQNSQVFTVDFQP